jgi:ketosteroid isomerase-like protein
VLLVPLLALAASGCAKEAEPEPREGEGEPTAAAPRDSEADRQGVIEAHQAFVRAWETADVEGVVSLLDAAPPLLIFHPKLRSRFDSLAEVRAGLGRMFSKIGGARWVEAHPVVTVRGDVAWLTTHVAVESDNVDPVMVRGTEIWLRESAGWKLAHAHWSPDPEQ